MSDENTQQVPGGGEASPAAEVKAPRNDAEAAQQTAEQPAPAADEAAKAEEAKKADEAKQAEEKKRNRTRDYIDRLNREAAEARREAAEAKRRVEELERRTSPRPAQRAQGEDTGPDITQYATYPEYQAARDVWLLQKSREVWTQEQKQAEQQRREQETLTTYERRAAEFAESHPDFMEAVGSIDTQLLPAELQAAIMAHELGPQIAYHLANDEDALFNLASIRAELMPAAVARLASRLSAAPASTAAAPTRTAVAAPALAAKPISQAPPPVPQVGGRAPASPSPEKMTDDDWYKRDRELRRKR
jgi:hypothetical protein